MPSSRSVVRKKEWTLDLTMCLVSGWAQSCSLSGNPSHPNLCRSPLCHAMQWIAAGLCFFCFVALRDESRKELKQSSQGNEVRSEFAEPLPWRPTTAFTTSSKSKDFLVPICLGSNRKCLRLWRWRFFETNPNQLLGVVATSLLLLFFWLDLFPAKHKP